MKKFSAEGAPKPAAALSAAEAGARTALLEPTDWVGGQLTSSAVPAIDEAWHSIPQATLNPAESPSLSEIN